MHLFVLLDEEAQVEARFSLFGDSANLDARWVKVCMEHTICLKSIWMHPMELLDDVCHMESLFGLFINSVGFGARNVHGLRLMHHSLRNHFGSTCW